MTTSRYSLGCCSEITYPFEVARTIGARSFDLHNHLNFHSIVEGKSRHPYGRARMFADRLAKDFHHQIRKSIYNARLVTKILRRVDHAKNFDDAFD